MEFIIWLRKHDSDTLLYWTQDNEWTDFAHRAFPFQDYAHAQETKSALCHAATDKRDVIDIATHIKHETGFNDHDYYDPIEDF